MAKNRNELTLVLHKGGLATKSSVPSSLKEDEEWGLKLVGIEKPITDEDVDSFITTKLSSQGKSAVERWGDQEIVTMKSPNPESEEAQAEEYKSYDFQEWYDMVDIESTLFVTDGESREWYRTALGAAVNNKLK